MFINELNKREAIAFISLVKNLAEVDAAFAEEEGKLLEDYIEELSLGEELLRFMSVSEALNDLNASNSRAKNIIYFELLGLALVDGEFDIKEVNLLKLIGEKFAISEEKQGLYLDYFKEMKNIYNSQDVDVEAKLGLLQSKAQELLA